MFGFKKTSEQQAKNSKKRLSAAEQGAAWRSKQASQLPTSTYAPVRTAPAAAAVPEENAKETGPETSDTTAVPSPSATPGVEDEKKDGDAPVPSNAAAKLDRGEKTQSRAQELPLPPNLKRVIKMSGIDNLSLLMENDGYQCVCWSMYEFKSELDLPTVDDFFRNLAQMYPKYRYVVELNPSHASRLEKARRKREAEGIAKPSAEDIDKKKRTRIFNKGRRTFYSKTLAAGSHWSPARWRFDEEFDVTENIEEVKCPGQGTEKDLHALAGSFLSRKFDYNKPIWAALLVTGVNTSEGAKSALMIKIHHCFSDGQGMIQSYHTALAALEAKRPIEEVQSQVDRAAASKQKDQKTEGGHRVKPTIGGTISHGWHTVRGLYFRSRKSFAYDTKRTNSDARVPGRLYAQSEGIAMEDIKMIRTAFSNDKMKLTLNDVACALLSRALRIAAEREAEQRDTKVKGKRVAVFVPISVRPAGDWSLSNFTTGAIAWFSFHDSHEKSVEEILGQVNREMGRIKRSHLPKIWYHSFDFFCKRRIWMLPNYPIWRSIFEKAYREYHVATNVPGPSKPVSFGGQEAFAYHVLPPSSPGKSTLAIGMISYAGSFSLGVSCDDVPELGRLPDTVTAAFQDAARELIDAAKIKLGKA